MNMVVVAVIAIGVLGTPQGIAFALGSAVIVAAARSRGTLAERTREFLRTGYLQATAAFAFAALVLDDWASVAIIWLIVAFVIGSWRARGAASDRDRWALISGFVAALAALAMASLMINWVSTPVAAWFVVVALVAAGVVGAVLRWMELPWLASKPSRARTVGIAANLICCVLIIGVTFI